MHLRSALAATLVAIALCPACAARPPLPTADKSAVWGSVRLLPPDGVRGAASAAGAYGDRRLRDAELVDYSRPGFTVVHLAGSNSEPTGAAVSEPAEVVIRDGELGPRIWPTQLAMRAGAPLRIVNRSSSAHTLSCPSARHLAQLAAGESTLIEQPAAGGHTLYLLDSTAATGLVFAAPGPFVVASGSGRFALTELPPGRYRIHAWHPRLPPTSRWIELEAGTATRVDLELGAGQSEAGADAAQ